jgi:hypothetical protein
MSWVSPQLLERRIDDLLRTDSKFFSSFDDNGFWWYNYNRQLFVYSHEALDSWKYLVSH